MKYFVFNVLWILILSSNCYSQGRLLDFRINETFEKMELLGVNTEKPLLYSYFFSDKSDPNKLLNLKDSLIKLGYSKIKTQFVDADCSGVILELIVEENIIHSQNSLYSKLRELNLLASKCGISIYEDQIKWTAQKIDNSQIILDDKSFGYHLDSLSEIIIYEKGKKLMNLNYYDKSIIAFDKCVEKDFRADTCLILMAWCYSFQDKIEESIRMCNKAIILNPKYIQAYFMLGQFYYRLGKHENAINTFNKVIELEPKNEYAYMAIAKSLYELKDYKKSKKYCEKALEIDPKNAEASQYIEYIKLKGL